MNDDARMERDAERAIEFLGLSGLDIEEAATPEVASGILETRVQAIVFLGFYFSRQSEPFRATLSLLQGGISPIAPERTV